MSKFLAVLPRSLASCARRGTAPRMPLTGNSMSVTVTTFAPSMLLSTRVRVKAELEITATTWDSLFDELLGQASAAVDTYCNRIFARQVYSETLGAYGGSFLALYHAPVIALTSITFKSTALTDVTLEDATEGLLTREAGFGWTTQRYAGLSAIGGWLNEGTPIPLEEQSNFTAVYPAGYIVPAANLLSVATVSVAATDQSFNDSAAGFPALLKDGDVIETSGFSNAVNNGRFAVNGAPTTSKIIVDGGATLVLEAASAGRTVLVQSLPKDVEAAVIQTVKSYYAARAVDSRIVERHAGPIGIRMSESPSAFAGVPPLAAGLLRPWIRRR